MLCAALFLGYLRQLAQTVIETALAHSQYLSKLAQARLRIFHPRIRRIAEGGSERFQPHALLDGSYLHQSAGGGGVGLVKIRRLADGHSVDAVRGLALVDYAFEFQHALRKPEDSQDGKYLLFVFEIHQPQRSPFAHFGVHSLLFEQSGELGGVVVAVHREFEMIALSLFLIPLRGRDIDTPAHQKETFEIALCRAAGLPRKRRDAPFGKGEILHRLRRKAGGHRNGERRAPLFHARFDVFCRDLELSGIHGLQQFHHREALGIRGQPEHQIAPSAYDVDIPALLRRRRQERTHFARVFRQNGEQFAFGIILE